MEKNKIEKNKMTFDKFKNKYVINGEITVQNALHIGSGIEKDNRDAPFISLDDNKEFYIPGSSFRGYLSTKLERFLDSDNDFKLKEKKSGETLNEADVMLIFGYTNLDKLKTKISEDNQKEKEEKLVEKNIKIQKRIAEKLDITEITDELNADKIKEKIKDIRSMAGRIHVSDMPVIKDVEAITRDGIKIDRNTGATKKGAKFDYDVVPAGTKFELHIELENIEDYQLDLLGLALRDIMNEEGDLFGGKISRGIGKCRLENLTLAYVDASDKKSLKKYIFEGKLTEKECKFETNNLTI